MTEKADQTNDWVFEILRPLDTGYSRVFRVTQTVDAGNLTPEAAAERIKDPVDGEVILVRFRAGGGVTAFKVGVPDPAPTFTVVTGREDVVE